MARSDRSERLFESDAEDYPVRGESGKPENGTPKDVTGPGTPGENGRPMAENFLILGLPMSELRALWPSSSEYTATISYVAALGSTSSS